MAFTLGTNVFCKVVYAKSFSTADSTALSLCHQFSGMFFQNLLYHVQCCILGDCICSYERALSFLPKTTLCMTMCFCLVR